MKVSTKLGHLVMHIFFFFTELGKFMIRYLMRKNLADL